MEQAWRVPGTERLGYTGLWSVVREFGYLPGRVGSHWGEGTVREGSFERSLTRGGTCRVVTSTAGVGLKVWTPTSSHPLPGEGPLVFMAQVLDGVCLNSGGKGVSPPTWPVAPP